MEVFVRCEGGPIESASFSAVAAWHGIYIVLCKLSDSSEGNRATTRTRNKIVNCTAGRPLESKMREGNCDAWSQVLMTMLMIISYRCCICSSLNDSRPR